MYSVIICVQVCNWFTHLQPEWQTRHYIIAIITMNDNLSFLLKERTKHNKCCSGIKVTFPLWWIVMQLSVSKGVVGSLICNQNNKLHVILTILFLQCRVFFILLLVYFVSVDIPNIHHYGYSTLPVVARWMKEAKYQNFPKWIDVYSLYTLICYFSQHGLLQKS